ncbi:MAG TPA: hypothetical protein DEH02_00150 [Bacteroidales bacterium]|nr:hypothetical protein [Bacteroidales bacterium]
MVASLIFNPKSGASVIVTVGMVVNSSEQKDGATPVTKILKVVLEEKFPVGKLILPPVPTTTLPIFESSASFLN